MDMGGGLGRVTRHPDYYLNDGSVSFLTGNVLFRVHKSFFERESDVFRDLFAEAAQDDPHSGTDARPFTPDVSPDEFAKLLWVWYDREYAYRQQTKENWVTILSLATRWQFLKIRELAVREIEALELSPAERISIYNEHGIDVADARFMQMETLIKVLQAREDAQRRAAELGHESPTSASLEDETLREIVFKFFNQGLNPRSSGTSTGSGGQAPDLNGERRNKLTAVGSTVTLGQPQVPDRSAQSAAGSSPHTNSFSQAGSGEKESREKVQRKEAEREEKEKEKARQAKEKEEKERSQKTKLAREKEEKEKAEKEKQAREKEEKERAEKAKQDKDKDAREREQKPGSKYGKTWGN